MEMGPFGVAGDNWSRGIRNDNDAQQKGNWELPSSSERGHRKEMAIYEEGRPSDIKSAGALTLNLALF